MQEQVRIKQLSIVEDHIEELAGLLVDVVNEGASIGFLPPLTKAESRVYWDDVIQEDVRCFVLIEDDKVVGSVQLQLCMKKNGLHRAEIAKLMIHPSARRQGYGRRLLDAAETSAREDKRTLIVLDTRDGDPSNLLYQSHGYIYAGQIPLYARSETGELDPTNYYYKILK
ncbi:GNAT family N-acetyltransferase [Paenibacillus sp. FSL H7-0326]|uniref:GNAT family N-acetyltransferase n=1 Tax=Paenibacillus sp. FSL H7-0326 TaxID=1921144 RepID=UPI00096F781E|nr:GNAT family N-acetyltransferase [Paenibacillus sp. FSL H7-0326]OMC70702.1 GNAT family N-acetyltransferase [Paenibacillus sp. FSL H7-0326]